MGKPSNMNLIGVFALLMASIVLFGCASQPSTPAPNQTICSTDVKACPDGSSVARDPASNCQFIACPQPVACTAEAKICPDGSSVGRNASRGCAFNDCPAVVVPVIPPVQNATNQTNATLAGIGADCAGTTGIACQAGLQCLTSGQPGEVGTCTAPAPATQQLIQCPSVRNQFCTADINPVCGKGTDTKSTFRDYTNPCQACATTSNAIGYYMGTCVNQ